MSHNVERGVCPNCRDKTHDLYGEEALCLKCETERCQGKLEEHTREPDIDSMYDGN
ncbi:MAG: hypothetical protein ACYSW3_25320 [Planctomycetota bacterium]|jgi:hypothetical protein